MANVGASGRLTLRTSPPGGARPALVGGGRVTGDDDGFDPLDGGERRAHWAARLGGAELVSRGSKIGVHGETVAVVAQHRQSVR